MTSPRPSPTIPGVRLRHASLTDVGRVRQRNEDSLVVNEEAGLFAVADGMGGHQAGDVASSVAVAVLQSFLSDPGLARGNRQLHRSLRRERRADVARSFDAYQVARAFNAANDQIQVRASLDPELASMGTTVVALLFKRRRVVVAHVGDSRIYRLRAGRLAQITRDHSLANEYLDAGVLRHTDMRRFPYNHIIVRSMGLTEVVRPDIRTMSYAAGDRFLLCTDGLTDLVDDADIRAVLEQAARPEDACESLVHTALERGGHDNVTAMTIFVEAPAPHDNAASLDKSEPRPQ